MRKETGLIVTLLVGVVAMGSGTACSGDIRDLIPFGNEGESPAGGAPYGGETTPGDVTYAGGDGTSIEKAVIILGASGEFEGVDSEYTWLETKFGPEGKYWQSPRQDLVHENGRYYDKLTVEFLKDVGGYSRGDTAEFYFDITDFFGKF